MKKVAILGAAAILTIAGFFGTRAMAEDTNCPLAGTSQCPMVQMDCCKGR